MLHSKFAVSNVRIDPSVDLRPLNARSIVLSLLLGTHPPEISVSRLLEFTALFDLADGTVRTALSRMVASGELVRDGSRYSLGPRLLERQAQQDTGRHHPGDAWDGTWWFAIVIADRRGIAERRSLRNRLGGARFGELRPDTWMRPANVAVTLDDPDAILTRGRLVTGDDADLVDRLWDLAALDRQAERLVDQIEPARARLVEAPAGPSIRDAFASMASAQRYLRSEPQLPPLLHPGIAQRELRLTYEATVDAFQTALSLATATPKFAP
jgi:phenylacetic acid degradation operon negative regulatory protein